MIITLNGIVITKKGDETVVYCPRCGATLNDNALFCSKCGAKIDREDRTNGSYYTSRQGEQWHCDPGQTAGTVPKKKIGCGTYFTVFQVIIVIVVFIWLKTDSGKIAVTDLSAYLDGGETYIDMITTSDIELLDITYGSFINQSFDNCSWEYFKNESGDRIVELNCRERTYGTPVCMQFMITPIGNDLYYIETCYMSINGYTVSDILSLIYGLI